MPALSLKIPIPILWVFFVPLFRLIFPIKEQNKTEILCSFVPIVAAQDFLFYINLFYYPYYTTYILLLQVQFQ